MIVISNHIHTIGMKYPDGAVIRINLAWVSTLDAVDAIIKNAVGHKIWMDYPTGRTKPPAPNMSLMEAIRMCNAHRNSVAYFAFSNAEDRNTIELIRHVVDPIIELVPKIETRRGIDNFANIIAAAKTSTIMLDKEDLYIDCDTNPDLFNAQVTKVRNDCVQAGVTCLELKGVIFGHQD